MHKVPMGWTRDAMLNIINGLNGCYDEITFQAARGNILRCVVVVDNRKLVYEKELFPNWN